MPEEQDDWYPYKQDHHHQRIESKYRAFLMVTMSRRIQTEQLLLSWLPELVPKPVSDPGVRMWIGGDPPLPEPKSLALDEKTVAVAQHPGR